MINRRLIRIKVLQILYSSRKKEESNSISAVENELFHSINKFYDLYLMLFLLLEELSKLEEHKINIRTKGLSNKKQQIANVKLSDNEFIKKILANTELHEEKEKRKLNWKVYNEFISQIYKSLVSTDLYNNYINLEKTSYKDDKEFVKEFFTKFILDNAAVHEFLEDSSIYWNDDLDFAILMILKNVDFVKSPDNSIKLFPLFKNEDDKDYAKNLLRKTIINFNKQLDIIRDNTKNWDIERIADIDLLILQIAITELFEFSSIPVKVTMNEYIEISKYYSTPKSNIFINGVLDKIIKKYKVGEGINKKGRGLVQ